MITAFNEFLNKISRLESSRELGAIIIQLLASFTISESNRLEIFLDTLRMQYDIKNKNNIAIELRHNSWNTEGVLELLHHFNIASVLTDFPEHENLGFLSNENNLTSNNLPVVRFHGRNTTRDHYWYDYLYSEKEFTPWIKKFNRINENTDTNSIYINSHYGGKAIVNSLQFKELINNQPLPEIEKRIMEKAKKYLTNTL